MRFVVGFRGTEATDRLIRQLRATQAQSLIIFQRNFRSPEQFLRLRYQLEEALQRRFLILVDHEGGRVVRFDRGVTRFPSARCMGCSRDPQTIAQQGGVEAEELRRLGVHVNLAPCVDVVRAHADPIIGERSYGTDPAMVSRLSIARLLALQSRGVAACAKHFPGLGSVPRDPHRILPTIRLRWQEVSRVDLLPFRTAIAAGVATVMSSHVCYPALGDPPGLPATFSPRLIQGVLRKRLRFPGAILTDDLEMGALRTFGSMANVAIRATRAGHDLLLICSQPAAAAEALSGLVRGYATGQLDGDCLEASVERIRHLRKIFCRSS